MPCAVANDCWSLMREFMAGFLGNNVTETTTNHFKSKMDAIYTPQDTVLQYLEHFNNFRKTVGQVAQR